MKILISISSCEIFEKSGLNDPLRETWLPDAVKLGMDYKFFHGAGSTEKEDVVVLPVDDSLGGLTEKAKARRNGWWIMAMIMLFHVSPILTLVLFASIIAITLSMTTTVAYISTLAVLRIAKAVPVIFSVVKRAKEFIKIRLAT